MYSAWATSWFVRPRATRSAICCSVAAQSAPRRLPAAHTPELTPRVVSQDCGSTGFERRRCLGERSPSRSALVERATGRAHGAKQTGSQHGRAAADETALSATVRAASESPAASATRARPNASLSETPTPAARGDAAIRSSTAAASSSRPAAASACTSPNHAG